MRSLISVIAINVGKKEADNAHEVLDKVLNSRHAGPAPGPARQGKAASVDASEESHTIIVTRTGSQPSTKGPAEHFTGGVRVDSLFQAHDPSRTSGAYVTFEPGARTAWHKHPFGQVLIVTAGSGLIQQWGGPIEEIRQGDVVWIPPGVKHWHGAAATTGMTHIAIQEQLDGKTADWMEKVTDAQYQAGK
jgi:quercetin dioxygenase-like cupin family protein